MLTLLMFHLFLVSYQIGSKQPVIRNKDHVMLSKVLKTG